MNKRYEYDYLCRLIVKAESRDAAEKIVGQELSRLVEYLVGLPIVREYETWFQNPFERVVEETGQTLARAKIQVETAIRAAEAKTDPVAGLKQYLAKSGKSQEKVAKALGISNSTVNAWINDRWRPAPDMANKITQFLLSQQETKE